MAAPSKSWTAIPDSKIDADSPVVEELKTFERDNGVHDDERIGIPAAPGNRQANHRHRGLDVDGSDVIELTPQENLVAGSDGVNGIAPNAWTTATDVAVGNISFHNGLAAGAPGTVPRRIQRSDGSSFFGTARDRLIVRKLIIPPIQKIKAAGGLGRFTLSHFVKREAAASGVVGGTYRFGLHDGTTWITPAFVDIDFDDVTTEYKRFFFISNNVARSVAFNVRFEWTAQPSDWDTVINGDVVGHLGGVMINNGAGLAKWDIAHRDGTADNYIFTPTDDIIYWWDEVITLSQETV